MAMLEASEITGGDAGLTAALAAAGLPVDDLTLPGRRFFCFHAHICLHAHNGAGAGHDCVGYGGLESLGDGAVLLRSLVVTPAARSKGVGRAIVNQLRRIAAADGVPDAWLITSNLANWFAQQGFIIVPRNEAPASLKATRQFSGLCPASAIVMRNTLENTHQCI